MGKDKSLLEVSQVEDEENETPFEERVKSCSKIAKPMCSKKSLLRIRKLIKKAAKDPKTSLVYGTKSVQRMLRKNAKGIMLLSGSVKPIDTLTHIPGICEEKNMPYIYVPCNDDLKGGKINRAPIMLVYPKEEYMEAYNKVAEDIKNTPLGF